MHLVGVVLWLAHAGEVPAVSLFDPHAADAADRWRHYADDRWLPVCGASATQVRMDVQG